MEIDIREEVSTTVQVIRVADQDTCYTTADTLTKASKPHSGCYIEDSADGGSVLGVFSEEHALNLISGLKKAIDLGWFE